MKEKLTVSCEGKPCYDIVLTIGFEELAGAALSVSAPERKICIVTDTNVALLYAAQVKEAFSSAFAQVEVFEFPAGEENKTLANIQTLYAFLIEHHFDRKDMLAALGGGVVFLDAVQRPSETGNGQPVEQQAFTTEIAENMDTQASSERKKMAIELTSNIVVKYEIARKCIFEIARDLTRVKEERLFIEMGVGSFDEYCQKVAGFGDRQGRNFINIYKRFSEEEINEYKHLGSTKMAYMAELDDTDLGELMATHDLESVTTRELRKLVDEYKNKYEQITLLLDEEKSKNAESTSLESQVEELRKQLEAAHQANEDMESGALNAEKRFEEQKAALLKENEVLSEQIRELESRPTEKAEISEEERNALIQQGREEMCKEKDEDWSNVVELARKTATRNTEKKFTEEISSLKILNDELRKVADGAKESTKKYKDEVAKLKAENAALQSNAQNSPAPTPMSGARDKVKFYFKQIESAFTAVTQAVSEADAEERTELTTALKKALERMSATLEQTE